MTTSNAPFVDSLGASRPPLRVNPAVVVGLGDFGGAALHLLVARLRPTHPALLEGIGWLWLTMSGWGAQAWPDPPPDPAAEHMAPVSVAPAPLAQALDQATSQATVAASERAGYDVGTALDTVVVARVDDPLAQEALWPLLDLIRAQPPLRENRVTLVLASDSRRFAGPSAPALARFWGALAERLVTDRANPVSGAVAWCYLCDTLDVDSRLLGGGGGIKEVVQSQVELVGGFLALLIGSGLRRDPAYARTASAELAHDVSAPLDTALVSSFSVGAYVMPVAPIAALARDRLALRLHEAAFPSQASVQDREAAWSARERLLAATDLSPRGLRGRLLRGPDGTRLRFDTTPPDLTGLDPQAALQALARWRVDLEAQWADESTSPLAQSTRNADALLEELTGLVRREVDGLVEDDPRGLYQALAFLEEMPQAIEEARVQLLADDSDSAKRTIPSADESFRQLGDQVTGKRRPWHSLLLASVVYVPLIVLSLQMQRTVWPILLALWLGTMISILALQPWRQRRQLAERRADFITAVRLKFRTTQERKLRAQRRDTLEGLLEAIRRERQALLAWQETIAAAPTTLVDADVPSFRPACGERPLCDAADYPSPVQGYDGEQIAALAALHLDPHTRPRWRESDVGIIVAWLREGAERALAGWQRGIGVAGWSEPEPAQAINELAAAVQTQWPLAPDERRQVELNLVGLPERDELLLPQLERRGQIVVSTYDSARLSYAPTCHGLRLKESAATRPLWQSALEPGRLAARDAIHKTFVWRYAPAGEVEEHHINLVLSRPRYQAFKAEPRPPRGQWGRLVAAPAPELDALAAAFGELHRQRNWSPLEQASNVLAFTQQCITYDSDLRTAPAGEWPRYPLETLAEGVGDCEDDVILAAAVLKRLDFDVALLYYPGHCALGVAGTAESRGELVEDAQTGVRYFYGETTAEGWSLGQVPQKYRETAPEGVEVVRFNLPARRQP